MGKLVQNVVLEAFWRELLSNGVFIYNGANSYPMAYLYTMARTSIQWRELIFNVSSIMPCYFEAVRWYALDYNCICNYVSDCCHR